jgi:hypothetical protein
VYACDGDKPQDCNGKCIGANDLCILEPLPGGVSVITAEDLQGGGISVFFYYVNNGVWQWAFSIGVAIAVLQGTVAGFQIVTSNGDSGKIGAAKERFLWATFGLLVLLLSGVILNFINPLGFTAG